MGIALIGADNVIWWGGDINSGVVQVFLAWVIAPLLAGVAASLIFLITKYGILRRQNSAIKALYTVPFYFLLTSALLTSMFASHHYDLLSELLTCHSAYCVEGWQ